MHTPIYFRPTDEQAQEFLRKIQSGHLVTNTEQGLLSTLIPLVFLPESQTFIGHIGRPNIQGKLSTNQEALLISCVNEAYISPNWYASKIEHGKVVPTLDYMMVHAYGHLTIHNDAEWLLNQVTQLTNRFEASFKNPWSVSDAPADYIAGLLNGITGVELKLTRIEASFKMSQNKSTADLDGLTAGLAAINKHEIADTINELRPAEKKCPHMDGNKPLPLSSIRRSTVCYNILATSAFLLFSLFISSSC